MRNHSILIQVVVHYYLSYVLLFLSIRKNPHPSSIFLQRDTQQYQSSENFFETNKCAINFHLTMTTYSTMTVQDLTKNSIPTRTFSFGLFMD